MPHHATTKTHLGNQNTGTFTYLSKLWPPPPFYWERAQYRSDSGVLFSPGTAPPGRFQQFPPHRATTNTHRGYQNTGNFHCLSQLWPPPPFSLIAVPILI